jgi:hypothetical protein
LSPSGWEDRRTKPSSSTLRCWRRFDSLRPRGGSVSVARSCPSRSVLPRSSQRDGAPFAARPPLLQRAGRKQAGGARRPQSKDRTQGALLRLAH